MATFHFSGPTFYYNDQPTRIISGAIHYFRIVPEYWRDRLLKLKACGCNTVETYVAWNLHEPQKGKFCFEGMADIVRFIELAGELGLHVIVRPSPYICAEWEFGGMPSWLLADPGMRLRCYHPPFLEHVDAYYDVLLPKLKPLLCTNGGPIIAMQIENEYGSYGNDKRYLNHLKESMISRGMDVLLFTSDGAEDSMLQGGMVPGALATVNFGSRTKEAFDKLREYQPDAPVMCMEYWDGWFDHWSDEHHTRSAGDAAHVLDEILSENGSVNFYMFHGGTNFGFYNGANAHTVDGYEPTITSYDYDAPLNEAGEPTEKYFAIREVISKYVELGPCELPAPIPKKAYGRLELKELAPLSAQLDAISKPIHSAYPETMEMLGQDYGFIHYNTFITGPRPKDEFVIQNLRDRAQVFLNGKLAATLDRRDSETKLEFDVPSEGLHVSILVENMGRINYGPFMREYKGITEGVRFGRQFLSEWTTYTLPLTDLTGLKFEDFDALSEQSEPSFYRAALTVDEPCDTFLSFEGWTKGVVFINGYNLGRYWNLGPQKTMYVPGPLLKQGDNEIIILELHGTSDAAVTFLDQPDLG